MQHSHTAPSEVNFVAVRENPCRCALKELVGADIIPLRQNTAVDHHVPDLFYGKRELAIQPIKLLAVRIKVGEIFMSADMVPVDVGGDGDDGLVRQLMTSS
jgi:hypothetical protein